MDTGALSGQRHRMPLELELQVVVVLLAWDGCWASNSCCLKGPCVPLTTGPSLWGRLSHFSKVIYAQYYKFLVNFWAFLFELKSAINSLPHVWMDFFFLCALLWRIACHACFCDPHLSCPSLSLGLAWSCLCSLAPCNSSFTVYQTLTHSRENRLSPRNDWKQRGGIIPLEEGRFLSAPWTLDVWDHSDLKIISLASKSERISTSASVRAKAGHDPRCSWVSWEAGEVRTCSSGSVMSVTPKFYYCRSNTGKNVKVIAAVSCR